MLNVLKETTCYKNSKLRKCKHICAFQACVSARRGGKHAAKPHNQNCFVVFICTDVCLLLARAMWKSPIPQAMTAMQQQQVDQDILRGHGPKVTVSRRPLCC